MTAAAIQASGRQTRRRLPGQPGRRPEGPRHQLHAPSSKPSSNFCTQKFANEISKTVKCSKFSPRLSPSSQLRTYATAKVSD